MSETWTLKCSDGEEYTFLTLNAPNDFSYNARFQLLKGAYGHHGMPVKYLSDPIPGIAGEELRDEQRPIREIYMPIRIQGSDAADFETNKAALRRSLRPDNTVELWITNSLGDTRVCYMKYLEGFDKAVDDDKRTTTWLNVPLRLAGFDPYFYDIPGNEITHTVDYSAPMRPFYRTPWFGDPWVINKAGVDRTWTVINDGDEDAYPIWKVAGPGNAPRFENLTTGKTFLLNYTLAAGETVTADFRDYGGNPHTVESELGGVTKNLRPYMDATLRTMWPLVPGPNDLAVELSAGQGGAAVEFSFLNRFEGV
jgi:hypothetical protein